MAILEQVKRMTSDGKDVAYWGGLAAIILFIYIFMSNRQFSVTLTLSGTIQAFGFGLVLLKIIKSRSVSGLSKQTFLCYSIVFSIRAVLFLFFKGYLPSDSSGDYLYIIQEFISTGLSIYILYLLMTKYSSLSNQNTEMISSKFLICGAAVVALIFHPSLNRNFVADYFWAFTQFLEAIAVLPQLIMFSKKSGDIESNTGHFVASQAISRVLSIIFWVFCYKELNTLEHAHSYSIIPDYVGYGFLVSQIINLILMGDFMYYWIKSMWKGSSNIQLPTFI